MLISIFFCNYFLIIKKPTARPRFCSIQSQTKKVVVVVVFVVVVVLVVVLVVVVVVVVRVVGLVVFVIVVIIVGQRNLILKFGQTQLLLC